MRGLLIISFFSLLGCAATAATLNVCPSCECTSLTEAIASAVDGDRILVHPGTYTEGQIVVDKAVHLIGKDNPVLDGEGNSEVLTLLSDHITVEGFTIKNVGINYLEDRAGVRVKKAKHFVVKNNTLLNTFFGIYLEHASDGIVSGNQVIGEAIQESSSGNAIHAWYCKRLLIEKNLVKNHRDGIYFEFVDNSEIRENASEDNLRYGLHFMFSNEDDYSDNSFRNNGAGVAVMFSKKINMWSNCFEKNWGKASFGLLLKEIYDAEIRDNHFIENTIGIYIESSTRIQYQDNDFLHNGWAIKMMGGCLDNTISENNFLSNTFDLSVGSGTIENNFNGNHWSSYSGYDLDRNGIGDIPYRPVKLFNYVVNQTPEAMVLLRSLFVDIINFSEKVSPVFTPKNVVDNAPLMKAKVRQRSYESRQPLKSHN